MATPTERIEAVFDKRRQMREAWFRLRLEHGVQALEAGKMEFAPSLIYRKHEYDTYSFTTEADMEWVREEFKKRTNGCFECMIDYRYIPEFQLRCQFVEPKKEERSKSPVSTDCNC